MKKMTWILTLILLTAFVFQLSAFADGGNGSGGGSGSALGLDTSSVQDGEADVDVGATITLTFTKNVVNMSVRDNNMGCFSLTDGEGNPAPFTVVMGDDQVDPSVKRIIEIDPDGDLAPGTTYTLTVSKALASKSGDSLEDDISITFTTKGADSAPSASQGAEQQAASPSDSQAPSAEASGATWYTIAAAILIIAAVVIYLLVRKKKKEN